MATTSNGYHSASPPPTVPDEGPGLSEISSGAVPVPRDPATGLIPHYLDIDDLPADFRARLNGPAIPAPSEAADTDDNQEAVDPTPTTPKNKGGAPKGNQNARKHGYYSKHNTPEDLDLLAEIQKTDSHDLSPEIDLMRLKLARQVNSPYPNEELILKTVRAITRMTYVQHRMTGKK